MGSLYQWEAQPGEKEQASGGEGRQVAPILMVHWSHVPAGLKERDCSAGPDAGSLMTLPGGAPTSILFLLGCWG